jgi:hypothetical protein
VIVAICPARFVATPDRNTIARGDRRSIGAHDGLSCSSPGRRVRRPTLKGPATGPSNSECKFLRNSDVRQETPSDESDLVGRGYGARSIRSRAWELQCHIYSGVTYSSEAALILRVAIPLDLNVRLSKDHDQALGAERSEVPHRLAGGAWEGGGNPTG